MVKKNDIITYLNERLLIIEKKLDYLHKQVYRQNIIITVLFVLMFVFALTLYKAFFFNNYTIGLYQEISNELDFTQHQTVDTKNSTQSTKKGLLNIDK